MDPEAKARQVIDQKLAEAGWTLQDKKDIDLFVSLGVAVREFETTDGHEVDYALFIDGTPVGIIEAKEDNEGVHLITEAAEQNAEYVKAGLKNHEDEKDQLRFIYEATSQVTHFTDMKDPEPRVRKIFQFHRPETLKALIDEYEREGKTLRGRLRNFPPLPEEGFRKCQITAVTNLEKSFGENRPRALVQMATGAGKTFTAITNCYRLLKFAKAKRILFLVDTRQLGEQAETEYKNYKPYDSAEKLKDLYNIVRIQSSYIPQDTQICISTVQRLYMMLSNEIENATDNIDNDEEAYKTTPTKKELQYNKDYPPEFFDFIIIDECHRSIYNVWKQVLEYFDAFLVGLTATPSKYTYAFFDQNVVSEYTHAQAVDDGVNVGALGTYYIETQITQNGGTVERDLQQQLEIRDKRTRRQRWETADQDVDYTPSELDKKVVSPSQIQTVIEALRDNWQKWEHFKMRTEIPKTLIFAKDDSHADDIVKTTRLVFGKGNDFCKKVTYKSEEEDGSVLYDFRNEYNPRIAVTVNKIATGTDVKAIEILVFMRDIRSENYYEQMLGRARRTMTRDELVKCTPDAVCDKLGYVVVDAVGVTKSPKTNGNKKCGGDTKPSVGFKALMNGIAQGDYTDQTLTTAGTRLEHLAKVMTPAEHKNFEKLANGKKLSDIAAALKHVHDEDDVLALCKTQNPNFDIIAPTEQAKIRRQVIKERAKKVVREISDPKVREFLFKITNSNDQTIDPAIDKILNQGFDTDVEQNKEKIRSLFKDFIDKEKDEITALQIIYNQDYKNRSLTEAMIKELYEKMTFYNSSLKKEMLFAAYGEMTQKKSVLKQLTDIIQIIKYEWGMVSEISPFADLVRKNYKNWIFLQNNNKQVKFTPEQNQWLELIRDYIAINAGITPADMRSGKFLEMGGGAKFVKLFGSKANAILTELNYTLQAA